MTTASTPRFRHRAAWLGAAAVGALALSGCELNSPTTTELRYAPADGVEVDGDALDVRDLLVVSHGNGDPAVVSGAVINSSEAPVELSVTVAGSPLDQPLMVEPGQLLRLDGTSPDGTEGEPLLVPALESPAGQSVEVRLVAGDETLATNAPVLLPQGPYAHLADLTGGPVEPPAEDEHADEGH